MKLELDPLDLKDEYLKGEDGSKDQDINTREVTYDKLNKNAQAAVDAVGKATFYSWGRETYEAVYPPTHGVFPKREPGEGEKLCPNDGITYSDVPDNEDNFGCPICKAVGPHHLPIPDTGK